MLPNPETDRMIAELERLLTELKDGRQPTNSLLEAAVRIRARGDMLRESIDALLPAS